MEKARELGTLATTAIFIQDAKKAVDGKANLEDMVNFWEPILGELIKKVGDSSLEPLRNSFSFPAAEDYRQMNDTLLWQWFSQVIAIKKEFSIFLKQLQEEKSTTIEQQLKETVIEKEKIEKTLQEYIDENLRMKMEGVTAPNTPDLLAATEEDKAIVARNYQFHPVKNYDIKGVKKISNPFLSQQFKMYKQILQERFSSMAFSPRPHWKGYTLDLSYTTAPADTQIQSEQLYLYLENGEIKFKAKNWAGHIEAKTILNSVQSAADKQSSL